VSPAALVFGASGTIGSAVAAQLSDDGFEVWSTTRGGDPAERTLEFDPARPETITNLSSVPPLSAVVWAQGVNCNDSVLDVDTAQLRHVLDVNTLLVLDSMHALLAGGSICDGARLCVISSIWQQITRRNKLSYTVSKAALDGVVRSAAADLAPSQILVNAVLPGVLDTPMTRSVLSAEQVAAFEDATGFGRLVSMGDVVNTVSFLVSPRNTGITGQSIAVDLGYGHARNV
jgi:3-oxoacyl-[acyl-carrier protein] reductase